MSTKTKMSYQPANHGSSVEKTQHPHHLSILAAFGPGEAHNQDRQRLKSYKDVTVVRSPPPNMLALALAEPHNQEILNNLAAFR